MSISVTRFNNETYETFSKYNNTIEGCVYNCPVRMKESIAPSKKIYVIEMNNSTNQIMGIGIVNGKTLVRKHKIYKDINYNRYSYEGKKRITREDLNEKDLRYLSLIESKIFYTKSHLKRGHGIQNVPDILHCLFKNNDEYESITLIAFIKSLFKKDNFDLSPDVEVEVEVESINDVCNT